MPGTPALGPLPAFLEHNKDDEIPPVSGTTCWKPRGRAIDPRIDPLIAAALAVATFLLYLPTLSSDFVGFDDPLWLTDNPVVKQGLTLHGLQWAFSTNLPHDWLPMVWLSHMAAVSLFGPNAGWHHAVNMGLHALNAALVFLVIGSMTGRRWPAALVAAMFAFHPLRVESVAWVTERKDVLSGTFFLLTLLAYTRFVRHPGVLRHGLVLLLFVAALLSKSIVVTLPFLLLLLDVWPLGRGRWTLRTLGEKAPLLLLTLIACAVTFVVQRRLHTMMGSRFWSPGERAANAVVSVARYLEKLFWPAKLSVFYPHPALWRVRTVLASSILVLLVTLLAWRFFKRAPFLLVGWLWFLGMLVPVCGLVPVGLASMADRYTYLPSIGLLFALVWAGVELAREFPSARRILASLAVIALAALAAATWHREAAWRTTLDLFQDALAVDDQNWMAHDYVGMELAKRGDSAGAMVHFQLAADLNPLYPFPWIHMGAMYFHDPSARSMDRALALLHRGVELAPDLPSAHQWLGMALTMKGKYQDADREFAVAVRLAPDDPGLLAAWALSMAVRGRFDRARELARAAVDIDAHDASAISAVKKIDQMDNQRRGDVHQIDGLRPLP